MTLIILFPADFHLDKNQETKVLTVSKLVDSMARRHILPSKIL